jgi:hypothetical protein
MDSDAISEEGRFEIMNYEVTSTAATDLYARTGRDTSKIRGYVGKVFLLFLIMAGMMLIKTDSS